ncbi:DUF4435 domain-containing protein [Chryseobacterium sp.]|uniref:DUF4435 domain-containing protein n=1 Tax=Chryseobacterium sp. TaxID=1871047 RepID=UPI0011C7C2FF|nr:DUF4435 domain-containing protein [Chryseobacterium sp.]TXF78842.1 DUF4435 domain-containing protein [Chryseobacterium sp.]
MNIVEESKQELETKLVAYTEFMLDFKKDNNSVYCFYEGKEDRSYYSVRIDLITGSNMQKFHYTCNGKSNVIGIEKLLKKNSVYSQCNLLYFIDKDFDDNLHISNEIYVTKFYGIENFYSVEESFKNILINEYHISPNDENFSKSLELFKASQNEFHSKLLNINSWLACQADYRNINKTSTRLNIDDSLRTYYSRDIFENCVKSNFSINLDSDINDISKFSSIFPSAPPISNEIVNAKISLFSSLKYEENFRGKFELKFLVCFLKRFQEDIAQKNSTIFTKRFSSSLRYEYATMISQLSSCAITHDCLKKYIVDNTINKNVA